MANPLNILAGQKAAGPTGTSLVYARNMKDYSSLPTSATATIDTAAFKDMGNCDSKGADIKTQIQKTDFKSFGSLSAQGTLYTDYSATLDITFQETTPDVVAMFRSQPLGSITADSSGAFSAAIGSPQDVRYQLIVEGFSQHGDHMRFVLPNVANTNPGDFNLQMGQLLDRPITFTMYPDDKGNLFYEYYVVNSLGSSASPWAANTAYATGSKVTVSGGTLQATAGGTSASTPPVLPGSVGGTVTDGSVTWTRTA